MTKQSIYIPLRHSIRQLVPLITLVFMYGITQAQNLTQTVRGTVLDKISQSPIAGAVVVVLNTEPLKGTATDANGQFTLTNVPVGRQSFRITYIGYKETTLSNIAINSGKEVVLNVQMDENIVQANEVVVKANARKEKPINELATVSTRTFSVEETQKFAAAVNDPARMATSFAGVVQTDDGNNGISIRGNSPNGMLWRMEGLDIPNPNHFSSVGTSGGGISILNSQLLSNSDFMTGAFSAEYGNALSGVFDLKLRKGNNEKREYTFQAGLLGVDLATEGPFKKGYGGSYLINYRYSTLSIFDAIGLKLGQGVTNFQDLSFNVSLPTKKYGQFGVFGFGGLSSQRNNAVKDSDEWRKESYKQYSLDFTANTGAVGLNHTKRFGAKTYIKSAVTLSGYYTGGSQDRMNGNYQLEQYYEQSYHNNRAAISSTITHKVNARSSLRGGFIYSLLDYSLTQRARIDSVGIMKTWLETSGQTSTLQMFGNWNYRLNEKLSTNMGMHYLQLMLNNSYSVEPRASVKYELNPRNTFALGYGLHGQIQPLGTYFSIPYSGGASQNRNLGISKAHHYVMAWDVNINPYTHIKTELYYQHLFNIPISTDSGSTFCILNSTDGYANEQLSNKGIGRNYGVELTVERFLHNNFYYLLSTSVFDSKYRAGNNVWYNTRFNTNVTASFTAGKEWQLSEKRKKKVVGVNIKTVYTGGMRRTPIDAQQSRIAQNEVYVQSRSFEEKNPAYFRLDTRFSIKRNFAHSTSTIALDIQNTTSRKNVGGTYYDTYTGTVKSWHQTPLIPVLSYRLEF